MILVADASFAAKVILQEEGTDIARGSWEDAAVTWVVPALIGPEVQAALDVHHRRHAASFDADVHRAASESWAGMLDQVAIRTLDAALARRAIQATRDHGPLRGADACYLAVAQELVDATGGDAVALGTFDRQQRRAAQHAGLVLAP